MSQARSSYAIELNPGILLATMSKLLGLFFILVVVLVATVIITRKPKTLGEFIATLFDVISSSKPPRAKPQKARPVESAEVFPYYSRKQLLTKGELAFFQVLKQAVADQYMISMKVRLADIITCPGNYWNKGYGSKITQKHVDFVLIDPNDTSIKTVIELNDKTHKRERRQKRDAFLANALRAANIPLVEIQAAASYDVAGLRSTLLARRIEE
ncbi:MAG: hypothetical protein DHS20C16_32090 [Phycisphaerae bacterium]|nr:MAG: hypothetical protein DHS20C16_32090 [Phycisphaerae bacterium]